MKVCLSLFFAACLVLSAEAQSASHASGAPVPILEAAALPSYPGVWRTAHFSGKVVALVHVKSGRVVSVERRSGEPELFQTTSENIHTWRFAETVNASFPVTFDYEIASKETDELTNPSVEITPALDVRIIARPVKPTVNY